MPRLDFQLFFQCSVSKECQVRPQLSNRHFLLNLQSVAKDRFWFGDDYTPFTSVLECGLSVEGIGSVKLPTKISPDRAGPKGHVILYLSDVLHVPGAVCNILGAPLVWEYALELNWNDPSSSSIRDRSGQQLAYFRYASDGKQFALRLSGPPVGPKVGPAPLSASTVYYFKATWPDAERYRWTAYKALPNAQAAASNNVNNGDLGMTTMPRVAPNSSPNSSRFVQEWDLSERFARVVSLGEQETRDRFMFPQLHEAVRSIVGEAIPALWFNQEDTEDDLHKEYDTSVMGKFVCTNSKCHKSGWSNLMVAVWIRLYCGHRRDGYNAVVFNQRCISCDCLGTLTLHEKSYVERVSYRLRKWAGAPVKPPLYAGGSQAPHVEERCEGCKQGHCSQSQRHEDE